MAEPNYTVNYEDERFKQVETDKTNEINKTTTMYNGMINQSDSYYQAQIDASKEWANTQTDLQNQQTELLTEQINQQKDQANKDYTREQKGAYTDFQKQTNAYGANAEQMAASGLTNSGYSETSRVSMYNTYQNRYAMAKDSYNRAVLNYDNSIKEAKLSNSAKIAEIAYQSLQTQLQLSLEGFQYKNNLLLQQADAINKVNDTYYNRYQNVLQQINQENALQEQIRQYNEQLAEEKRQYNETMAFNKSEATRNQKNWEKQYALSKASASRSSSGGSSGVNLTNGGNNNGTQLTQGDDKKQTTSVRNDVVKRVGNTLAELANVTSKGKYGLTKTIQAATIKQSQREALNKVYSSGTINQAEFTYLAERYGL